MVDFVTTEDPKLHYLLASDAVDNVDVYEKYGPETWVADGEILDNDEFFSSCIYFFHSLSPSTLSLLFYAQHASKN